MPKSPLMAPLPSFVPPEDAALVAVAARDHLGRFLPGAIGNPRGKALAPAQLTRLYRHYSEAAALVAVEIMMNPEAADADRLRALQFIAERGYGKPVQPVAKGKVNDFDQLSDGEISAYIRERAQQVVARPLTPEVADDDEDY